MASAREIPMSWCEEHQDWCPTTVPMSDSARELLGLVSLALVRLDGLAISRARRPEPPIVRYRQQPRRRRCVAATTRREA